MRSSHAHRPPPPIEDFIPIREISAEASREKSIRKGHISTLHLWWARRPLVAARAAVYAALVPAPQTPEERKQYKCGNDSTTHGVVFAMVGAGPRAGPQRDAPNHNDPDAGNHGGIAPTR
ncbi:MAG: DUF1156 domain-containing protein [Roseiflexaceae bacterium]